MFIQVEPRFVNMYVERKKTKKNKTTTLSKSAKCTGNNLWVIIPESRGKFKFSQHIASHDVQPFRTHDL